MTYFSVAHSTIKAPGSSHSSLAVVPLVAVQGIGVCRGRCSRVLDRESVRVPRYPRTFHVNHKFFPEISRGTNTSEACSKLKKRDVLTKDKQSNEPCSVTNHYFPSQCLLAAKKYAVLHTCAAWRESVSVRGW